MTTHRSAMRVEIRRVVAPDGRPAVLFQTDEWHVLLSPYDALEVANSLSAVAVGIIAERN